MTRLEIQGIVFDVDGVLFDTERLTHQTWKAVSREMGWPQVGEAYLEFVGQNRTDIFRKMVELFGEEFPKETFMKVCSAYSQARMEREGVPMKPGVREILEFLKERGIPTALATSTGRPRTERRMEMTGLGPCFSAIITGDQVEHSKPDLSGPGHRPGAHHRRGGLPQRHPLRLPGGHAGHHGAGHDPSHPRAGGPPVPALRRSPPGPAASG